MSSRIYIDMDGTLCRFHDTEHTYIEKMWERGFYINLKPFEEFVQAISLLIERNPDTQFYILSAILDTDPPFAAQEKREWLHTYLPQIKDEQMLFIPAGADKSAYIKDFDETCILVDDYNKNLAEWQKSGGTAIKFINDINNRGLGAYGGEKGKLWDGLSVRYDDSSMTTCLSIEHIAGITAKEEYKGNYYNFPGDVRPEDFIRLLPKYFEERKIIDNSVLGIMYRQGENFYSFSSLNPSSVDIVQETLSNKVSALAKEFLSANHTDEAMLDCLEACYRTVRTNDISFSKALGWINASFRHGSWRTYPITPSNMQSFFSSHIARDELLNTLYLQLSSLEASSKKLERKMYMPTSDEVAKDVLLSGAKQENMSLQSAKMLTELVELKKEWLSLAKADYPNISFGKGNKAFSDYKNLNKNDLIK